MKLEVGMYVRTERNGICKIRKITQDLIEYENSYFDFIDYKSMLFDIKKASHNLLGNENELCLIEVGDYVNGNKVIRIETSSYPEDKNAKIIVCCGDDDYYLYYNEDIKTILTKEQYENNSYKVEE